MYNEIFLIFSVFFSYTSFSALSIFMVWFLLFDLLFLFQRIWPELTKSMKAKEREIYPPVVLYTEFISYIKGLSMSLETEEGELSLEQ